MLPLLLLLLLGFAAITAEPRAHRSILLLLLLLLAVLAPLPLLPLLQPASLLELPPSTASLLLSTDPAASLLFLLQLPDPGPWPTAAATPLGSTLLPDRSASFRLYMPLPHSHGSSTSVKLFAFRYR
jgi:hypothetical protein